MTYPNTYDIDAVNDIFAHGGRKSVPTEGYVLADSVTDPVEKGTPLKRGATAKELLPVSADADVTFAIAAAYVDPAKGIAIPAHEEGEFNANQIAKVLPEGTTIEGLALTAARGIYFRDVIKAV
jgi:hypothetical protein